MACLYPHRLPENTALTHSESASADRLLSVVIPVYNDAQALSAFLPELAAWLGGQNGQHEIIIVDDGSRDPLDATCRPLNDRLPENTVLRLIRLSRNFGKEAALSAGLAYSNGQAVVMMDADGQHPTAVLAEMLHHYRNGADVVAAVQTDRRHESRLTRILKSGFYRFIQDGGRYEIRPNAGDFRLMDRKVVDALLALPERQRFMKGLYAWVGFKTVYLPFQAHARQEGSSKFNRARLFELALVGITSFSQKPLRWISRMGMLVSAASLLYGLYIVGHTLFFGRDVPGWATVAAGVMFSAGIQLICLGLIGEYVGRIYEEVKQRPLYIIDSVWQGGDNGRNPNPPSRPDKQGN